jgi:hypothetical protein
MGEEQKEEQPGLGEQAKALREDMSPAKLNAKLEEVIEERPKTAHLLDFRIVGRALLAAAVIAIILGLLVSWPIAAVALVVVFFGGWLLGAQLSYDRRRPTRDASDEDDDQEDSGGSTGSGAEEDDSPSRQSEARSGSEDSDEYQGDRGEVEADQEQEGKDKESARS